MGAINNLTLSDEVDGSTSFAVSQNGEDVRVLPSSLKAYLDSLAASSNGVIEYAAPSATGFSVSISETSGANVWLVLTPAANYATGTINLPSASNSVEGQEVVVNSTKSITSTLDVLSSGATVTGHPTTLAVNGYFKMKYEPVLKTWYRVG